MGDSITHPSGTITNKRKSIFKGFNGKNSRCQKTLKDAADKRSEVHKSRNAAHQDPPQPLSEAKAAKTKAMKMTRPAPLPRARPADQRSEVHEKPAPQPPRHPQSTAATAKRSESRDDGAPHPARGASRATAKSPTSRRAKRSPRKPRRRRSGFWLNRGRARSAGVLLVRRAPEPTEMTPKARDPSLSFRVGKGATSVPASQSKQSQETTPPPQSKQW